MTIHLKISTKSVLKRKAYVRDTNGLQIRSIVSRNLQWAQESLSAYTGGLGTDANRSSPILDPNHRWRNCLRLEFDYLFCPIIAGVTTHLFCLPAYAIHTNFNDGDSPDKKHHRKFKYVLRHGYWCKNSQVKPRTFYSRLSYCNPCDRRHRKEFLGDLSDEKIPCSCNRIFHLVRNVNCWYAGCISRPTDI